MLSLFPDVNIEIIVAIEIEFKLIIYSHKNLNVFEMELNANTIISSSCSFQMALNCVIFLI